MKLHAIQKMKVVIMATGADEFAHAVRVSQASSRHGRTIIPLQCADEVLTALKKHNELLLVLEPSYPLSSSEQKLVHELMIQRTQWCTFKYYMGALTGFAKIQTIHDVLEWIRWHETSSLKVVGEKIVCAICRTIALSLLILLIPLFVTIAAAIKISSPGPVFYRQVRVGHKGRTFNLIKFRTMRVDAERDGPRWCAGDDDFRIFPIGRFLRKSHLDELPQLWNVIRGELCFVGPRPERPEFHSMLEEHIPHFRIRARVKPGITGWAQLKSGYAATLEDSRKKIEHDLYFIHSKGPRLILSIVFGTVKKILNEVASAGLSFLRKAK